MSDMYMKNHEEVFMYLYHHFFIAVLAGLILVCVPHSSRADGVTGKIQSEKTIKGTLNGAGVDSYTFKVPEGKGFVIAVSETGAHTEGFLPGLNIFGPDNKLADSGGQDFYVKLMQPKPQAGEWRAEVSRLDSHKNGGSYELTLVQFPGAKGKPMKSGQTYEGSITRGGIDVYTISGTPDSTAKLALMPTAGQNFMPEFTIFAPDGELAATKGCIELCDKNLQLQQAGDYTLLLGRADHYDGKGVYAISLTTAHDGRAPQMTGAGGTPMRDSGAGMQDTPATTPFTGKIQSGKPLKGMITGSAVDSYTFKVKKGKGFVITASETGPHTEGFMPGLNIFGPDNKIVSGSGQDFYARHLQPQAQAQEGEWRAEVSRAFGGQVGGNYELTLLQFPGAKGKPMTFGQTYEGSLSRGEVDVYTISGTPDVLARLTLTPKEGQGLPHEITVIAPNGEPATSGGIERSYRDIKMTELGDYTVLLGRSDHVDGKVGYSLTVARTDGHMEVPEMTAERLIQFSSAEIMPSEKREMDRRAEIYVRGMFLTFSPHDVGASRSGADGNPLKLLALGDATSDTKSAIKDWKKAADLGNADAVNRLGMTYAQFYKDKKYEPAPWYKLILEQGPETPGVAIANKYLTGIGQGQDFAQAKKLFRGAAEQGDAAAQFNLASISTLTLDTPPDYAAVALWYEKAAQQGLVAAQNNLAALYENGWGVKQDDGKAVSWYLKAAEFNYPPALYALSRLSAAGRGMPQDAAKAAAWLKQAAGNGNAEAQMELAVAGGDTMGASQMLKKTGASGDPAALRKMVELYRKNGIPKTDYDDVLEIYRRAAREINPHIFAGLADLFAKQDSPDYFEAYFWYSLVLDSLPVVQLAPDEKQALADYATAEAGKLEKKLSPEQVAVAKWRIDDRHPRPVDEARKAAAEIYLRAGQAYTEGRYADAVLFDLQAAHHGSARAQLDLGRMFELGHNGLVQNIDKAIGYFKQSVRGGMWGGATEIGDLYRYGIGVPRDLGMAAQWYEMDASRGHKPAMDHLATIYLSLKQGKNAIALYEKAGARDQGVGNDMIGMIHMYGLGGVPVDTKKALKWYLKSADGGYPTGAIQAATILKDYEPRDYGRAFKMIRSHLTPVTLNNVAFMYEHGLSGEERPFMVGKDNPTAMDIYKRAADMCYGRAMYNIGRLHETGTDKPHISATPIKKDIAVARKWMEIAAENGSTAAAIWLDLRNLDSGNSNKKIPQYEVSAPPVSCIKVE